MVEKYKVPVSKKKEETVDQKFEKFTIDNIVKSLAANKHNDSTTSYYLLHKRWMADVLSDKNGQLSGHLTNGTFGNSARTLATSNPSKNDLKQLRMK